jgi:hypothetical protein
VISVIWSPDGLRIVAAGADGMVHIDDYNPSILQREAQRLVNDRQLTADELNAALNDIPQIAAPIATPMPATAPRAIPARLSLPSR